MSSKKDFILESITKFVERFTFYHFEDALSCEVRDGVTFYSWFLTSNSPYFDAHDIKLVFNLADNIGVSAYLTTFNGKVAFELLYLD